MPREVFVTGRTVAYALLVSFIHELYRDKKLPTRTTAFFEKRIKPQTSTYFAKNIQVLYKTNLFDSVAAISVRCVQLFLHLLCACQLRRCKCWALDEKSARSLSLSLPSPYISLYYIRCYCCSEKSDRTCEAQLYGRPIRNGLLFTCAALWWWKFVRRSRTHTLNRLGGSRRRRRVQPFYFMILLFLLKKKWRRKKELFIKFPPFNFSHKESRGAMNFYTLLKQTNSGGVELLWWKPPADWVR